MATRSAAVEIGKIVRSDSHVRYTCQIFGPGEHSIAPEPDDYAFGTFVRVPLRRRPPANARSGEIATCASVVGPEPNRPGG